MICPVCGFGMVREQEEYCMGVLCESVDACLMGHYSVSFSYGTHFDTIGWQEWGYTFGDARETREAEMSAAVWHLQRANDYMKGHL